MLTEGEKSSTTGWGMTSGWKVSEIRNPTPHTKHERKLTQSVKRDPVIYLVTIKVVLAYGDQPKTKRPSHQVQEKATGK